MDQATGHISKHFLKNIAINLEVKFQHVYSLFYSLFLHYCYSQGGCRNVAYCCIGARYDVFLKCMWNELTELL